MRLGVKTILPIIAIGGLALFASAGNVTVSGTAPTVDGADIANLTWTDTATDKTFNDTTNHGQSFTTGGDAGYTLNSVSFQTNTQSNQDPDPAPGNRTWKVRVVAIDANNTDTTTVVLETDHLQAAGTRWNVGDWLTWTLDTPVDLDPNTLYGIDVEHVTGGDWGNGIPYLRYNRSDDVAGAYRYTRADGDPATINSQTGHDRVFHLDIAAAGPDEDPPMLVGYVPSIGATDVPVGSNIEATFNESIQLGTSGNITLDNLSGGTDVVIDVASHGGQLSVSDSVLTIDPSSDLDTSTNYAVLFDAGSVTDTAPTPNDFAGITDPSVWPFTTSVPDSTEPGIDSLSPEDGETDVAVNTNLVITFDEDVQKGSGNIVITQTGGSEFESIPVGDARVSVSGAVATINPSGTLAYDTDYHVEIADGAFKDLSNNDFPGISGETAWNFTTASEVVGVPGTVVVSSSTPTVDGADIANLTWTDSATDKTFNDTANHGQSFTTGNDAAYTLNSISFQTNTQSNQDPDPAPGNRTWKVRVVAIDANNTDTTTVVLEDESLHLQPAGQRWNVGDWLTWTLVTPVNLAPNTLYGIDVEHVGGGDWGNGIPYLRYNRSDDVAGAYRYTKADGDPATINSQTGHDRVFHLDIAVTGPPSYEFATWIDGYEVGGLTGFDDDFDLDDIGNGLENFFGTDPSVFSQGLLAGTLVGGNMFGFTHPQNANPASDITAPAYSWSKDLLNWYADGASDSDGTKVDFNISVDDPVEGTTTVVAEVSGTLTPRLFMSVSVDQILPPPPVLEENFDGVTGPGLPDGWTTGKNAADNSSTTNWELGTPANVGPVPPGVPLPSAANCVATNISSNYDDPVTNLGIAHTDIWLRSPPIDLGAATEGTLTFQQWTQIEDVPGDLDYGSIRILDASDDSELAVIEPQTIDGNTTGWEEYSMALPAAAFTAAAGTIKVEWQFEGDDIDSFAGWYIDDVNVTVTGP